jgi:hypothetical protein
MSLGEFSFVFCTKNSPNDIISGNFDSEKVDQDEAFTIKIVIRAWNNGRRSAVFRPNSSFSDQMLKWSEISSGQMLKKNDNLFFFNYRVGAQHSECSIYSHRLSILVLYRVINWKVIKVSSIRVRFKQSLVNLNVWQCMSYESEWLLSLLLIWRSGR